MPTGETIETIFIEVDASRNTAPPAQKNGSGHFPTTLQKSGVPNQEMVKWDTPIDETCYPLPEEGLCRLADAQQPSSCYYHYFIQAHANKGELGRAREAHEIYDRTVKRASIIIEVLAQIIRRRHFHNVGRASYPQDYM